MTQEEQWRPVVGYVGLYSVSTLGRVRSEARLVRHNLGGWSRKRQRVRKTFADKDGYHKVTLSREGVNAIFTVHSVVLEAFVGPRPPGHVGCHNNNTPGDDRPENLRWDTLAGNFADKVANGTHARGERNVKAKLTEAAVLEIRKSCESSTSLGPKFGICAAHARRVRRGGVWAHV